MTATETREDRAKRFEREQKERRKAARKRARKQRALWLLGKLPIVIGVVAALFAAVALGALVFQGLVWNLGVVGLAAACGATVSKIGFWTGFGAVFLTTTLKSIVSGTDSARLNLNKG